MQWNLCTVVYVITDMHWYLYIIKFLCIIMISQIKVSVNAELKITRGYIAAVQSIGVVKCAHDRPRNDKPV